MKDQASIFSCNNYAASLNKFMLVLESSDLNFTTILQDHNHNIFVKTINNFLDLKKKRSTINKKMLVFISLVSHNFEGHFANIVPPL